MVCPSVNRIVGAKLPRRPLLWDLDIENGRISSINPHDFNNADSDGSTSHGVYNAQGGLVAPSLCHAHIHLDKCFLLQDTKFIDLAVEKGDFEEAMSLGSSAKERMTHDDLLRRGRQLIEESIEHGVTAIRAFVEVDGIVELRCLDAGIQLQQDFAERCHIQICAFAQLPLFSGEEDGEPVRKLMKEAAARSEVEVVGSTPYVEDDDGQRPKRNADWIIDLALEHGKMLDLHLDYHLEQDKQPLVWAVVDGLRAKDWEEKGNRQITLGHCTRLTFFSDQDWQKLRQATKSLRVGFVGLPTSDLFMMRTEQGYRGSLHIPDIIKNKGFEGAIAVNNVGNSFTPQGNCDPLSIASLGVGLYQTGTVADAELLYDCVSQRAKSCIGLPDVSKQDLQEGQPADLVIFPLDKCSWRTRRMISHAVYDPCPGRTTIYQGRMTNVTT